MATMEGFKHGVNLGGWLSQCVHTKEHYETFITEEDLKVIKSWGLDHVRIPVDYNLVQNLDGSFKEEGFAYIQKAIDWCKNNNLNMILDLHKTIGYSFDEFHGESGFFEDEKYQNMFYSLWEEFAKRYSKYEDMLCFELLNEVTKQDYCKLWNKIANNCIEKIRETSKTVRILVGSYWNNSVSAVKDMDPPHDEYIVYNFHCYEPLIFTHQGAGWIPKMNKDFRMKLDETFENYDKYTKANVSQEGDNFAAYDKNATPDISYFENLFASAIEVAKERNVLLYCGEYGVIDYTAPEEVVKWYKLVNQVFEKYNIGRAAWSYKKMNFGLADSWIDSVRPEILKLM